MRTVVAFKEINSESVTYFKERGINCQIVDCYDSEYFKSPIGDEDFSSFAKSNNLNDDKKYMNHCLLMNDGHVFYSDSLFDLETKEVIHPHVI